MSEQASERAVIPRARLHTSDKPPSVRERLLKGLCTRDELEQALDVCWRTLYLYTEQGMPYLRVGGKRYFEIDRVRDWMLSREIDRSPRPVGRPRKVTTSRK
jgi:hypothetical protein